MLLAYSKEDLVESKKRGNESAKKDLFILYKKIGNFTKILDLYPEYNQLVVNG